MYEWRRLICNAKVWLLMLGFIAAQVVGFFVIQLLEHENNISEFNECLTSQIEVYRNISLEQALVDVTEKKEQLESLEIEQIDESFRIQKVVVGLLYEQIVHLTQYESYLEQIQGNAEMQMKLPVFLNKNSFAMKNIQKTAEDFGDILNKIADREYSSKICLCNSYSIRQIFQLGKGNRILLFLFCIFLNTRIFESKKRG